MGERGFNSAAEGATPRNRSGKRTIDPAGNTAGILESDAGRINAGAAHPPKGQTRALRLKSLRYQGQKGQAAKPVYSRL